MATGRDLLGRPGDDQVLPSGRRKAASNDPRNGVSSVRRPLSSISSASGSPYTGDRGTPLDTHGVGQVVVDAVGVVGER